jgi:hypothetical protein
MAKSTPETTARVGRNPRNRGGYLVYRANDEAWPLEDEMVVELESKVRHRLVTGVIWPSANRFVRFSADRAFQGLLFSARAPFGPCRSISRVNR